MLSISHRPILGTESLSTYKLYSAISERDVLDDETFSFFFSFFARYRELAASSLMITQVRELDQGSYQCRAENEVDSLDAVAELIVQGTRATAYTVFITLNREISRSIQYSQFRRSL